MRILADMGVDTRVVQLHNTRTPHLIGRLATMLAESTDALEKGAVVVVEESRRRVRYLAIGNVEGLPSK